MAKLEKGPHILVFPYPAQGHMLALLDLTRHLATHGLTITILVTPKNLPLLTPLLSSSPNIHPLVLPFPPHPSLPPGVENVRDIGNQGNTPITNSLANLQDPITHWFNTHPNPPLAIISDFFLGWTQHLAQKLDIPRIGFFSVSAFLISIFDYCANHLSLVRSQEVTTFQDLPNSPAFPRDHLPSLVRLYREADPEWEVVHDGHVMNGSSWGWVVNTFEGFESQYMEHLVKKMGRGRVFGVGPLSLLGESESESESGSGSDMVSLWYILGQIDNNSCMSELQKWSMWYVCLVALLVLGSSFVVISVLKSWLDGKPDGSVLYVCFGSQTVLSKDQMEALAIGLEHSGVHFLWVMKAETDDPVGLGSGSGRGRVIKGWAPQVAIMSHRAVGGFLSHCGWNSTLEAIVGGVMVLAWPMEADQFINARLLVEYHGAAVRVCEGRHTVPDSTKLARTIADAMGGDQSEKVKAKELKKKAREAMKEGGSSSRELDRLVSELSNLKPKTNVVGE